MGELSPWHLLIVAAVFVLLFGAKRLPDAARSVGKSLRIFKTEVKGLREDDAATTEPAQIPQTPQTPQDLPAIAPVVPPATPTSSDPTSPR